MEIGTTGPRDCETNPIISGVLVHLQWRLGGELVVIQGGARGVDRHVRRACELAGIECKTEYAWWTHPCDIKGGWCTPNHRRARGSGTYCPAAGLRRNQRMLDRYEPPLVIAFLDRDEPSPGTADMIERSEKFGCVVVIIDVRRSLGEAIALIDQNLAKIGLPPTILN